MKSSSRLANHNSEAEIMAMRFSEKTGCPIYEGPVSLEESDASHFAILIQKPNSDASSVWRVRREFLEKGVLEEEAIMNEALFGVFDDYFPEES